MIKIAYFDLGLSKEDFSLNPKRYGGAGVIPRYLKECKDIEFFCFAPASAYENFGPKDTKNRCFILSPEACQALQQGYPIDRALDGMEFDLILHFHTCMTLRKMNSLKAPICHISGFDGSAGHPYNNYILLYDPSFSPSFGEKAKYFKLGKPVPQNFQEYPKEKFVFQCSRMDWTMRPNFAIEECIKHGIEIYLAGPIQNDYPLFKNHKLIHYLGEIEENIKTELYKKAQMFTLLHDWNNLPFNQSVIEAQAYGTPVLVSNIGPFFKRYLKEGTNGFAYNGHNFLDSYEKCGSINQRDCWESAKEFSIEEMVDSLLKAFNEIIDEWKNKK